MKLIVILVVVAAFGSVHASRRPIAKRQTTFANCTNQEALAVVRTDCRDEFEDYISDSMSDTERIALVCESVCFRPILDVIAISTQDATNIELTLAYYNNGFCGYNENGERCSSIFIETLDNRILKEWESIKSNCLTSEDSVPGASVCTKNCTSALRNSVRNVGCCINIFNFTLPGSGYMQVETDYRLWNACGVQVPGFCSGGTRATTEATTRATTEATTRATTEATTRTTTEATTGSMKSTKVQTSPPNTFHNRQKTPFGEGQTTP